MVYIYKPFGKLLVSVDLRLPEFIHDLHIAIHYIQHWSFLCN